MVFRPFEVNVPHIVYACLGGFVVLFGMFSLFLRERLYIGEACWAFLFGIIIGPYGAGIFDPHSWGDNSDETTNAITLEFTRVVLAIGVFAIGVELPKAYMKRHWKSLFFMLGPIMTWGWFVSAAFIFALVPGLNFLSSLCVAACLTPTDPILAAAVIGGKYADKHVPAHIRHLLAAESGCNDGAAFPFLYIALYLMIDRTTGTAIKDWFLLLWLYQVVLGVVIGALLGIGFRYLMKFCEGHNLIDRHSYVAQYVSLAIFTIGVVVLLGSDDLLSTFACGTAFAWDGFFNRQTEESVFSSVIDLLFNIAAFVYVGAWMPFGTFTMKEELTLEVWRLIVIAILVLLFRRLPAMIACYKWMPDIKTFREALFSGHFGPIGIGAVFISTLAAEVLNEHINEVDAEGDSVSSGEGTTGGESISDQMRLLARTIQPITAFMVLCSITIHGLSIPGFSLSRRIHSRTFSRRTTIGAETSEGGRRLPEWATQVRQVGEGVVINKDPEHMNRRDEVDRAERGESSLSEKRSEENENEKASQEGESPGESTVLEKPGVIAVDHAKRPSRDEEEDIDSDALAPAHAERLPAGEVPPDGPEDEVIEEWQEGPHRVVERRRGPGEEVEVEVVKNWFYNGHGSHMSASASGLLLGGGGRSRKDSGASRKSTHGDHSHESKVFRGTKSSVRREVKDYIALLGGIERKAAKEVEKAEEKVEEGVKKAGEEVKEAVEGRPSQASEQDEEEGWASDHSNSGGSSQPLATASTSRSKSPRTKSIAVGAMAAGKRKKSVRKGTGLMGRVMRRTRTREEEQQVPDEEEEERGRRGRGSISAPRVIEPSSSPPSASTSSGIKVYPTRTRSRSPLSPLASPSSPAFSESGNQSPGGHRRSYSGQLALSPQGAERGREAGRERERGAGGGRLRHHRLDSLRVNEPTGLSSREQSPARSIRFFDEPQQPSSPLPYRDSFGGGTGGGSGPGTPMHGD